MERTKAATQQRILGAGKKQFLARGFREASLRSIVREAGVTTGAFYGYYGSKEELFDALVGEHYTALMERFCQAQVDFAALSPEDQPGNMGSFSGDCIDWMTDYMYEHIDAFRLLLCCAQGTKYEDFVHQMVEIEIDYTHRFMEVLGSLGHPVSGMDPQLEHILVSGMFSGYFEIIIHDMPKKQALRYVKELRRFYTAGWAEIMGVDLSGRPR